MTSTLFAVSVDENNQICDHAGRAASWEVYSVGAAESDPVLLWSLSLSNNGILHEWHAFEEQYTHPLHQVDVVISGSAGTGVRNKFASKNTELVATTEKDPVKAVKDYVAGNLEVSPPDAGCTCSCSH